MWHLLHWENRVRADPDRPGYFIFILFFFQDFEDPTLTHPFRNSVDAGEFSITLNAQGLMKVEPLALGKVLVLKQRLLLRFRSGCHHTAFHVRGTSLPSLSSCTSFRCHFRKGKFGIWQLVSKKIDSFSLIMLNAQVIAINYVGVTTEED